MSMQMQSWALMMFGSYSHLVPQMILIQPQFISLNSLWTGNCVKTLIGIGTALLLFSNYKYISVRNACNLFCHNYTTLHLADCFSQYTLGNHFSCTEFTTLARFLRTKWRITNISKYKHWYSTYKYNHVILLNSIWNSICQKFPYLVKKKLKEGEEVRRVAQLDWKIIESDIQKPFTTSGLEFVPLPVIRSISLQLHFILLCIFLSLYSYQVIHGEDYICLGFLFGRKSKVAYISDVSRFPPSTEYGNLLSANATLLVVLFNHLMLPCCLCLIFL